MNDHEALLKALHNSHYGINISNTNKKYLTESIIKELDKLGYEIVLKLI